MSRSLFDRRLGSLYSDKDEEFPSAQASLTSFLMQRQAASSYREYKSITGIVVAIGLPCLTIMVFFLTFLALSDDSLSRMYLTGVAMLFTVGVPALVASASWWTLGKRRFEEKQLFVHHTGHCVNCRADVVAVEAHRFAGVRTSLTDAIHCLTSDEATTQISALYELEAAARASEKDARLIVRAVEHLIQRSVPKADVNGSGPTHNDGKQAKPEVQVGLELLGRLPKFVRASANGPIRYRLNRLDLRGYNFQGLDFSAASLKSANLSRCVVSGALFEGADLRNAKLSQIVGEHASFRRALMERVSLNEAFVTSANFTGALLTHTDFRYAILAGSQLDHAILVDCDMRNADVRGASFAGAQTVGVSFASVHLDENSPLRLVSPLVETDN